MAESFERSLAQIQETSAHRGQRREGGAGERRLALKSKGRPALWILLL